MKERIKDNVALITIIACFVSIIMASFSNGNDCTYAIADNSNPDIHYVYVTDRVCTVTEISDDIITVETRDGNLYEFYGNGFEVNETVICVFNDADELIDVR